jgi:hypothetical protein
MSDHFDAAREQFITVRDTGRTNMLNRTGVQAIAAELGFDALVFYADAPDTYMEIIESF